VKIAKMLKARPKIVEKLELNFRDKGTVAGKPFLKAEIIDVFPPSGDKAPMTAKRINIFKRKGMKVPKNKAFVIAFWLPFKAFAAIGIVLWKPKEQSNTGKAAGRNFQSV